MSKKGERFELRYLEERYEFYVNALKHTQLFISEINCRLLKASGYSVGGIEQPPLISDYEKARLCCELDEFSARADVQEYHVGVYKDRIDSYEEIFDRDSKDTNLAWEKHWASVTELAEKRNIRMFLDLIEAHKKYLSQIDEVYPSSDGSSKNGKYKQEAKNSFYKETKRMMAEREVAMKKNQNKK